MKLEDVKPETEFIIGESLTNPEDYLGTNELFITTESDTFFNGNYFFLLREIKPEGLTGIFMKTNDNILTKHIKEDLMERKNSYDYGNISCLKDVHFIKPKSKKLNLKNILR